jgi:D-alanyl-D-alanine carboxypeptidase
MKKNQEQPQKRVNNILFLLPYLLVLILAGLITGDYLLQREITRYSLPLAIQTVPIHSYPMLQYPYQPYISARSAVVMDDLTKRALYEKNPTLRLSTASTAKIMTALVALDYYHPEDLLTVQRDHYEGSIVGFPKGETVSFADIMYGMLLPSGNDAAYTLAENYPGGMDAFVAKMNEKAHILHLDNSHFADPAGLLDDGSFMTVVDLARLCSFAMQNQIFAGIVGTKEKVFSGASGNTYDVTNINKLLGINGVIGIKTGQTEGAGEVLTTAKKENGRLFIIVVMQSTDRFGDTQNLLNLITNNITFFTPAPMR